LYSTLAPATFVNDATSAAQHGGAVQAGFQLRLTALAGAIYYTLDGSDPRAPSGLARGVAYTAPLPISANTFINVRVLNGTTWSALDSAFFSVNTVPATAANLVVSQIDYNPAGGTEFEFIELMNISAQNIDLTGVHLRDAVDYDFGDHTVPAPGDRIEVVGDPNAFAARYGNDPALKRVGPFVGNLGNG